MESGQPAEIRDLDDEDRNFIEQNLQEMQNLLSTVIGDGAAITPENLDIVYTAWVSDRDPEDDPFVAIVIFGIAFCQYIVDQTEMVWKVSIEGDSVEPVIYLEEAGLMVHPVNLVFERFEQGQTNFFQALYSELTQDDDDSDGMVDHRTYTNDGTDKPSFDLPKEVRDLDADDQTLVEQCLDAAQDILTAIVGRGTSVPITPENLDIAYAAWFNERDPDDDPTQAIVIFGVAFCQCIADESGLVWKTVVYEDRSEPIIHREDGNIMIHPISLVGKRFDGGETNFFSYLFPILVKSTADLAEKIKQREADT